MWKTLTIVYERARLSTFELPVIALSVDLRDVFSIARGIYLFVYGDTQTTTEDCVYRGEHLLTFFDAKGLAQLPDIL